MIKPSLTNPSLDRISFLARPPVSNNELNALFQAAWPEHKRRGFDIVLAHSLSWIAAFIEGELIGFVNIAWDGGSHAFLLDPTVHPKHRRRGIGTELVLRAVEAAREGGAEWMHVDYEPHLDAFYRGCGFRPTAAALMRLR